MPDPPGGELAVGADRRLGVGEQPAGDRDHPLLGDVGEERCAVRHDDAVGGTESGPRSTGHGVGAPTAAPEVAAGVEAATVAGVTGRADLVDRDEHRVTIAVQRNRFHPLLVARGVALDPVAPARLRLQYVQRPVVSVRCSASSSIQPTISTSPVSHCWATAAIRPWSSRLSRVAIAGSRAEGRTGADIPPFCLAQTRGVVPDAAARANPSSRRRAASRLPSRTRWVAGHFTTFTRPAEVATFVPGLLGVVVAFRQPAAVRPRPGRSRRGWLAWWLIVIGLTGVELAALLLGADHAHPTDQRPGQPLVAVDAVDGGRLRAVARPRLLADSALRWPERSRSSATWPAWWPRSGWTLAARRDGLPAGHDRRCLRQAVGAPGRARRGDVRVVVAGLALLRPVKPEFAQRTW